MSMQIDLFVSIPSSPTQDQMIFVIFIASRVRPSPALVEDCYVDGLRFLLVNSGQTLGLNSPTLRRMCASMKWPNKWFHCWDLKVLY
jgi:hypothetical protein